MTSRARRLALELQALDGLRGLSRDGLVVRDLDGRWLVARDGVPRDGSLPTSIDQIVTAVIERRSS